MQYNFSKRKLGGTRKAIRVEVCKILRNMKKLLLTAISIFGLATISMAQVPTYVPTSGLLAWWPFSGNATDESGNGNNGTNFGATLTQDRNGNLNSAYSFSGNKITTPNQVIPQYQSFTVSFWVKPSSTAGVQEFMSQNFWPSAFYVGMNGGYIRCGDTWASTGAYVNNSVWQNIVIVRNYPSNVSIFINGVIAATQPTDIILGGSPSDPLVFGKQYGSNLEYYSGVLDDIGIWNRALSWNEVCQLYYNPNFNISALTSTVCAGNSVTLTTSGASTYTWSNSSNMPSIVVSPSTSVNYTVNGTTLSGCNVVATKSIIVNPSPIITFNVGDSTSICLGANTLLYASSAPLTSFFWSVGITSFSIIVSPTVTTNYTTTATNVYGCTKSAVCKVVVNSCTGINEVDEINLVDVYPNPTNGFLNISLTSELSQNSSLEIYDALGKLVFKQVLVNELNTVNIYNLVNGIYTFKVLNNSNLMKTGKLIKQ